MKLQPDALRRMTPEQVRLMNRPRYTAKAVMQKLEDADWLLSTNRKTNGEFESETIPEAVFEEAMFLIRVARTDLARGKERGRFP